MSYTVGDYLVESLADLGLEHLFSIAGDYSIKWVNSYVEPKIRVIEEVSELCAGYAADGYARIKGIGALCVTYSAGALSAVNCIAGAYVEKVPIVLINGAPSIKRTLTYEQTGLSSHHIISGRESDLKIFRGITVAAVRIDNPDLAPMAIDYALTQCITEKRPVYIELLEDIVDLECERPKISRKAARRFSDPAEVERSLTTISQALENAANPLIWVGVEIDRLGLKENAQRLIHQLNIPYVTEFLSKAVLPEDDPLFAGVFDGQASSSTVQQLAKNADFVLALGVWLTDLNSLGWDPDFAKTAFVSHDTVKFGTYFSPQVALGDAVDGLLARNIRCKARTVPQNPNPLAPSIDLNEPITYQGVYDFLSQAPEFIDKDTIVGSDASMNYFGSLRLRVPAPGGFIVQSSYSSIGYIGPAATGMSLAKKDHQRVMVLAGDGGFQMSAQCLSTQTRFNLNPIILVIDNGVYGVEQWLADSTVFYEEEKAFYKSCILHRWNYSKLSEVFGCHGWQVGTYGELKDALSAAVAIKDSPSIIQVVVPNKSIPNNATWKAK